MQHKHFPLIHTQSLIFICLGSYPHPRLSLQITPPTYPPPLANINPNGLYQCFVSLHLLFTRSFLFTVHHRSDLEESALCMRVASCVHMCSAVPRRQRPCQTPLVSSTKTIKACLFVCKQDDTETMRGREEAKRYWGHIRIMEDFIHFL